MRSGDHATARELRMADLAALWAAAALQQRLRAGVPPAPAARPAGHTPGGPAAALPRLRDGGAYLWGTLDLHLLDVRPAEAFACAHIPEAASIPADELGARAHELPRTRERLVLVASTAQESRAAARTLAQPGDAAAPAVIADPIETWPGPWETGPARRVLWEPSPAVRTWVPRLPAGRALDLGCGTGRDAAYLAVAGHDVLAVDRLPEALERTSQLAHRLGTSLETLAIDLRRARPPAGDGYDLILMIRFLARDLLPWLAAALRPGGCFILEAFARAAGADGPRRDRWVLEPQEALRVAAALPAAGMSGWTVLEYLEGSRPGDPGLTRLVVRKPD